METKKSKLLHWNYILHYIKSSNKIKNNFINNEPNISQILTYELWEEIKDLYDFIVDDIFGDVEKAIHLFQAILKKYQNFM